MCLLFAYEQTCAILFCVYSSFLCCLLFCKDMLSMIVFFVVIAGGDWVSWNTGTAFFIMNLYMGHVLFIFFTYIDYNLDGPSQLL